MTEPRGPGPAPDIPTGGAEPRSPGRPDLGLALGGGAVLGFAHVGLLTALDEARIPVDRIAGTSAGAIAAALHAFGVEPDRMRQILSPLTWRKVSGFSHTSLGLLSNEPLAGLLERELGNARIEDATIPLAVVAADIHTGERVVLTEGPLGPAVRASAAIPGIYTPVEINGRILVDGGIVENVPIRAVREIGADIAVAATLGETLEFDRIHTLLGVLTNAFLIMVYTSTRLALELGRADIVIRPDLEPQNHWDMKQRDALIAKGFDAGRDAVPRIRAALTATGDG